jgi:hypothetical protein
MTGTDTLQPDFPVAMRLGDYVRDFDAASSAASADATKGRTATWAESTWIGACVARGRHGVDDPRPFPCCRWHSVALVPARAALCGSTVTHPLSSLY